MQSTVDWQVKNLPTESQSVGNKFFFFFVVKVDSLEIQWVLLTIKINIYWSLSQQASLFLWVTKILQKECHANRLKLIIMSYFEENFLKQLK